MLQVPKTSIVWRYSIQYQILITNGERQYYMRPSCGVQFRWQNVDILTYTNFTYHRARHYTNQYKYIGVLTMNVVKSIVRTPIQV